jgi:hypothetical protein
MAAKTNRLIANYADFWPYYLQEHARPATRNIHFAGTAAALLCLVVGVASGRVWFFGLAFVAGYGPAWLAHFFVENNRPATFSYPLWSLVSDFRMAWLRLSGRLSTELQKAGVADTQR